MDKWRDQLDEALDDALASYGKGPKNPGLERRILARVTEAHKNVYPTKALALAAGAAAIALSACLVLWVTPRMMVQTLPASNITRTSMKTKAPRTRTIPSSELPAALATVEKPRRIRKRTAEPKLPQFPAPSTLSSEERALVQLAQARDDLREVTYLERPLKPISIAAIEIRPIGSGWNTKEKECCDQ